ncbi:GntR family transcriptional regulator [Kineococcus rhizosphaerae]|uniref:GntR family transcriptional regulator n=2 Tax=Kineococcus rhizosphaerae TaxID=559628 RepID=A0A2T0QSA6_9ACTN|nr:GntR family transcriptional regulator [Kineococcus rhizosphaerae]
MRHRIISGAIAPGEHLVETRLSQELNISRGPLREALRLLEQEGLVVGDGRGHLSVREITVSEIIDVFEVRTSLEAAAMERLTRRSDRQEIARELREVLEPLRDGDLDFETQIEVDLDFHERICELSGNNMLTQMWHQIMGHIRMMIVASGPERASSRMRWQDHVPLADAIGDGDPARSRQLLETHMQDFCRRYAGDAMEREAGF